MSTRTLGALALVACALASPALAEDAVQESGAVTLSPSTQAAPPAETRRPHGQPGDLRILAGMHFAFAGELHVDPDRGPNFEQELDPTVGLQAGVDYVLMKYFALGGELRFSWWKPDNNLTVLQDDPGRSFFFDIDVKPRGRYAFARFPLEVYGTMPLGLSVAALNDDLGVDGGMGFNLGFGGGATYFFGSRFGVNTELLGVWHWFDGEVEIANIDIDTDNRTAQFYWFINGVFAI